MVEKTVAVRVAAISLTIKGNQILDRVTFDCGAGQWTLVYGASGSGKSTLLRAINGLVAPDEGCIWTLGTRIPGRSGAKAREVWRRTGTLLQEVALFETRSALENVALALRTVGLERPLAREQAAHWLERLALGHKLGDYPARLSGGERQRVALARAFAIGPRLLILDEPTSALDEDTAVTVLTAIRELAQAGTAVVMSSHRLGEVAELCDQRIAMAQGKVVDLERRSPAGEDRSLPREAWQRNGHLAAEPERRAARSAAPPVASEKQEPPPIADQKSIVSRLWRAFQ